MRTCFALTCVVMMFPALATPLGAQIKPPTFQEVSVHDPSIIRAGEMYYVFGSHLAAAKSADLMSWTQVADGVRDGNPLIPNVREEMREALEWGQSRTFWAGAVKQLADGRFYFYYCVCKGDSPRSALGLAIADRIEGPYKHQQLLLRSGMWNETSEDGTIYDATVHPNAIDPEVFYDRDGKLWMVYGSYSGGIFVLRLDEKTGRPIEGQGYGKKLMGANHSRIEGPHILYSPVTDYYYLTVSFGGLDSRGGYNIRIARSKNPDGPYLDPQGQDMINAAGPRGSFFDDRAIEPFGGKLVGNFQFSPADGQDPADAYGYVSPGHNSALYDEKSGKHFIVFHTRFPGRRELHQVRVHQLIMNADAWPVIAPRRYAGETIGAYADAQIAGEYELINHGRQITREIARPQKIQLTPDGTITGQLNGSWKKTGDHTITLTLNGKDYHGAAIEQWDSARKAPGMALTAMSNEGIAVWAIATDKPSASP